MLNRSLHQRQGPLSAALHRGKRLLFAVISKVGLATYSTFPIFGPLRASVGVIRNAARVLLIDRSDGRGFSFPGGLAFFWETAEQALVREILEETGLRVRKSIPLFTYSAANEIPCTITVFEVEADGELAESWEGSPCWLVLTEMRSSLLPSQRSIVDRLL